MTTELGALDIKLTASGLDAVLDAFKTVEARLASLNKLSKVAQSTALAEAKARLEVAKAATFEAKAKAAGAKDSAKAELEAQRATLKETERSEKQKTRIVETENKTRMREVKKAADAEEREIKRIAASRQRYAKQMAGTITGAIGGTLGLAGRVLGAGLALGGGFSLGDAFRREHQISKQATQIEVQSRGDFTKADAISQARKVGKDLNVDENDYLQGAYQFLLNTGKGQMTKDVLPDLARLGKAEGVDISELGRAAGQVAHQNKNMTAKEVTEFMRIVVGQGKSELGSVSLEEMTHVFSEATSKSGFYAGNQGDNQVKLASLVQVAKATTRGVDEAGTAANHITTDILKHQKNFGFATTESNGQLKDINYIIAHAIGSSGGDPRKLEKMFGERSIAIPAALLPTYREAEANKKGSGESAVMNQLRQINAERIGKAEEDRDLKKQEEDSFEQVDKAMKDLERAIGTELVPTLVNDLIPAIKDATPAFVSLLKGLVSLISWAEKHPWEAAFAGLGLKIGTAITGQIVQAGLSKAIESAILRLLGVKAVESGAGAIPGLTVASGVVGATTTAVGAAVVYGAGVTALTLQAQGEAEEAEAGKRANMTGAEVQQDLDARNAKIAELIKHRDANKSDPFERNKDTALISIQQAAANLDTEKLQSIKEAGAIMGKSFLETVQGSHFDFQSDNGGTPDPGPRAAKGANLSGK